MTPLDDAERRALSDQIFTILVKHAGANERDREQFRHFIDERGREFRFQGTLGFGGKFWNYLNRWYVNCYPEDENYARKNIIEATNAKLEELRKAANRGWI
jgi:hypothetical protein